MPPEPGSPAAWLVYAQSDLALARTGRVADVLLETLCFHAQQAAEKALKGILVANGVAVPRTHALETLITLLPANAMSNNLALRAASLSVYAVNYRYPQDDLPVDEEEYKSAVEAAADVLEWARQLVPQES